MEFRALQQFWRWTLKEEEIDRPPGAHESTARAVVSRPRRPATREDDGGRDFNDRRDAAILLFMYNTGVRLGETVGMRVGDIELRERRAHVTGKRGHTSPVRFGAMAAVAVDRYLRLRRAHRHSGLGALWLGLDGPLTSSGLPRSSRGGARTPCCLAYILVVQRA